MKPSIMIASHSGLMIKHVRQAIPTEGAAQDGNKKNINIKI